MQRKKAFCVVVASAAVLFTVAGSAVSKGGSPHQGKAREVVEKLKQTRIISIQTGGMATLAWP